MHRHAALLLLTALLTPALAAAQPAADTTYFPLSVGNRWTYFTLQERFMAPPDTVWNTASTVSGTTTVNDTLYFEIVAPELRAGLVRSDSLGRIWGRIANRDVLLFDFTLPDGTVTAFIHPEDPEHPYDVRIDRDVSLNIAAGRFTDGIRITFDIPEAVDDAYSYVFAPGIGIVFTVGGMGEFAELYEATFDGRVVTGAERHASATQSVYAYPNPFRASTTLVAPAPSAFAEVFDALGRRVAVFAPDSCSDALCQYRWDGAGVSQGAFFIRFDGLPRALQVVRITP
ncbi:MAG: hypothetical protein R2834_21570 [Rhodothermales bacterium]